MGSSFSGVDHNIFPTKRLYTVVYGISTIFRHTFAANSKNEDDWDKRRKMAGFLQHKKARPNLDFVLGAVLPRTHNLLITGIVGKYSM